MLGEQLSRAKLDRAVDDVVAADRARDVQRRQAIGQGAGVRLWGWVCERALP